MMAPKYEIDYDTSILVGEKKLYRIRACGEFAESTGLNWGGFVENENNLSQEGACWIYGNAKVYGDARVSDSVKILNDAIVYDYAKVSGKAIVAGNSKVFQRAEVYDSAVIDGFASIYGNANVFGTNTSVIGFARVHDDAWVYGVAIDGYANITRKTTKTPLVLRGLEYDITIMDDHVNIDCQTRTFDEWRAVTREEAFAMNGRTSLKFFNESVETIELLLQKYRKSRSNV